MSAKQNKYLTFLLEDENYGIPILKVKEIIGMMEITHVPKMPDYICGVINLRGKIIPIMDLRLKFNMESRDYDNRTCIVVVETAAALGQALRGIVVDTVYEVLEINPDDIEDPPISGDTRDSEYMTGMGKAKDKVILLLDTEKVLAQSETASMNILSGCNQTA